MGCAIAAGRDDVLRFADANGRVVAIRAAAAAKIDQQSRIAQVMENSGLLKQRRLGCRITMKQDHQTHGFRRIAIPGFQLLVVGRAEAMNGKGQADILRSNHVNRPGHVDAEQHGP
jgi:hypothetical protein